MAKYTYVTETVTPAERLKWMRRRHKRDNVKELPEGFSFTSQGRQGFIYYRESERVLECYWEMSGTPDVDIVINVFGLTRWVWPSLEDVSENDRARIHKLLEEWLAKSAHRAELHDMPY